MDIRDGKFAVEFARKTIELWVSERKTPEIPEVSKVFREKSGVFTTIYTYPEHELRGCIGLPYPVKPLIEAIVDSAVSAARDPRFPPLEKDELGRIVVELSILTKPEPIKVKKPEEYLEKIKIGRDGLIIRNGLQSGLLLPQVPVEYGWDVRTYLEHLCMKALLPRDAWTYEGTEIFRFRSEIFGERRPRGEILKLGTGNPKP